MKTRIDLTGQTFGKLYVIKRVENRKKKCGQQQVMYLCKCKCGNETIISYDNLKRQTRSCGCLQTEAISNMNKTHGLTKTRLHRIWCNMRNRCSNTNMKAYKDYGGRGIKVCEEWSNNFMNFYNWAIANGYKENLTIDRINNNGNYEPSNCRFSTAEQQAHNKRNSIMLSYKKETKHISVWAKEYNITRATLWKRLFVLNWDIEKALTKPLKKRR
nr:MAG TPA: PVL ORF-50-like family [Caudoviricetes sp.]